MTKLGEYFIKKSVNKATIGRRTGLSKQRLGLLTLYDDTKLRADELFLIALAMDVDPDELFFHVCGHLKLPQESSPALAEATTETK